MVCKMQSLAVVVLLRCYFYILLWLGTLGLEGSVGWGVPCVGLMQRSTGRAEGKLCTAVTCHSLVFGVCMTKHYNGVKTDH